MGIAAFMTLVPLSTGAGLALFPQAASWMPIWFWVVWFLFSVWGALDAPRRVEALLPPGRPNQCMRYARTGVALAVTNVIWSIAAVIYLGWWV